MIGNEGSALSLLMIPLAPVLPTVVAQVLERNRDESEAIALCLKKRELRFITGTDPVSRLFLWVH